MKTHLLPILLLPLFGAAQLKAVPAKDKKLVSLFASFDKLEQFDLAHNQVTVVTAKPLGQPQASPGTDEVTETLYISACESGEAPTCNLYQLDKLVRPKIEKVTEEGAQIKVVVTYGPAADRKKDTVSLPAHR